MTRQALRIGAALAVAAFLGGCGGEATTPVAGLVTYDDKPVAKGFITFAPADGRGPADGAEIVDGKYTVSLHKPGEKTVLVESVDESAGPISSEDANRPGAKPTKPKVNIPPNCTGNNQRVTVKGGETALNFDLKSTLVKKSGE